MNADPAARSAQTRIYWFRNDLRLEDNPALRQACPTRRKSVVCVLPSQRVGGDAL
jgi:deoxyribodipyrimidine photolyase